MLKKLSNRSVVYKAWAIIVALASVYLLIRLAFAWFYVGDFGRGLLPYDYFIMSGVLFSILADLFISQNKSQR